MQPPKSRAHQAALPTPTLSDHPRIQDLCYVFLSPTDALVVAVILYSIVCALLSAC